MRYILITRRALSIGLVLILAAAFVLAGVSNQYASGTAAQAQSRRLPVYCVETAEKKSPSPLMRLGARRIQRSF